MTTEHAARGPRATFYDTSPALRQAEVISKHTAWWAGQVVRSEVTATGLIVPSAGERAFVQDLGHGPAYDELRDRDRSPMRHVPKHLMGPFLGLGVGGTTGAHGQVSRQDLSGAGYLNFDVLVEQGARLEPHYVEDGEVARFMTAGDIHGGPHEDGGRILLQATLKLQV